MNVDRLAAEPPAEPKRGRLRFYAWALGTTGLAGLIAIGFLFAGDPRRLFALKADTGAGAAPGAKSSGLLGAPALDPQDPALHFAETHFGQVIFAKAGSNTCRRILFDNRTGLSHWSADIDCTHPAEQAVVSEKPDRLTAVKNSFKR